MQKKIGQINGREIYIASDVRECDLIAQAIIQQADLEKVKMGDRINIPFSRNYSSGIIEIEVKNIIR